MQLHEAVKQLEKFVETAARPGVLGLAGHRIEKRTQRELAVYFRKIGEDIVALKLDERTDGNNADTARHVVLMGLHNVLRKNRGLLTDIIKQNLEAAYLVALKIDYRVAESYSEDEDRDDHGRWTAGTSHGAGGTSVEELHRPEVNFVVTKGGGLTYLGKQVDANLKPGDALVGVNKKTGAMIVRDGSHDTAMKHLGAMKKALGIKEADDFKLVSPTAPPKEFPDKVGQSAKDAAAYAEKHAAELVTGIDQTTQQRVADAVASGIENQLGVGGVARLIKQLVGDMATSRALMIASTEINDAMSVAALVKMADFGADYKQIILSDDACPICEDNASLDPVPIDYVYPSGDDAPPFHPNCRCAITAARDPNED